jgi:hypothetical protein
MRQFEDFLVTVCQTAWTWTRETLIQTWVWDEIQVYMGMLLWIWNAICAFLRAVNFIIPIKSAVKWGVRIIVLGMLLWWILPPIRLCVPGYKYVDILVGTGVEVVTKRWLGWWKENVAVIGKF